MQGYSAKPKTNQDCPFYAKGFCKKVQKKCANKSGFYEECTIYKGNKSLKMFF